MRMQTFRQGALATATVAITVLCSAADDVSVRISTGVDYTSGDYGGTEDIEDTYAPVTLSVDSGRLGYRLTVPYLSVRAPSGTVITDGEPVAGSGPMTTERGLGDIIGSVTLYDVVNNHDLGVALDVTGKVKFATADDAKGLGTGEHDYSVQADVYKYLDDLTLLAGAGYKVRGDPNGVDLENVFFGSVGGVYQLSTPTRAGLIFDYRESAFADGKSIREVTGFVSHQIDESWRIQAHVLSGLSDASPDWGGGVMLKYVR